MLQFHDEIIIVIIIIIIIIIIIMLFLLLARQHLALFVSSTLHVSTKTKAQCGDI